MKTATKHHIDEEEAYRQKIREEEEYRAQLSKPQEKPKKKGIGVLGWLLIIFIGIPAIIMLITIKAIDPSAQIEKAKQAAENSQVTQTAHKIPFSPLRSGNFNYILIDPKYVDETDLEALGQELKDDYSSNPLVVLSVYDDQRAVSVRDAVINEQASQSDIALYDAHYVAQYNRNENTGFNRFAIYQNGSGQKIDKTIEY